ncbi:MAG: sigma factor, partial [Leeuwenhoekiella sp.]
MKNLDTYFLLKGLKDGEIQSLEKLYKIYYAKLFSFAKKFDSSTLGPDDFVQQTFLKLWEKRSQLKDDVLLDRQ